MTAVNPVVLGQVRAKQFFHKDKSRKKVIPVLMHGDAAFAGQGIVAECFAMSGLPGHNIGGTIHIIVNNQIGRFDCLQLYESFLQYYVQVNQTLQNILRLYLVRQKRRRHALKLG